MNHADSIMRTCARIVMHGVKTIHAESVHACTGFKFRGRRLLAINNAAGPLRRTGEMEQ